MKNFIEAVLNMIKTSVDEEGSPKNPLHVGEVMSCWMYLAGLEEAQAFIKAGLNTTVDDQLIHALLEDQKLGQSQIKDLQDFMIREGIPLPPASEAKPDSDPSSIPNGVKMTDNELANGLSIKIVALIMNAASAASQSVRNDIGYLFVKFLGEKLVLGTNIKAMMMNRGWIKIPPYYYPPGAP